MAALQGLNGPFNYSAPTTPAVQPYGQPFYTPSTPYQPPTPYQANTYTSPYYQAPTETKRYAD